MPGQTHCVKIKLKPGSLAEVDTWAQTLNARAKEVLQTLQDEGITLESAFLDRCEHGDYLIYIMRTNDMEKAQQVARTSTHTIDTFHKAFKTTCWQERTPLTRLIDFEGCQS